MTVGPAELFREASPRRTDAADRVHALPAGPAAAYVLDKAVALVLAQSQACAKGRGQCLLRCGDLAQVGARRGSVLALGGGEEMVPSPRGGLLAGPFSGGIDDRTLASREPDAQRYIARILDRWPTSTCHEVILAHTKNGHHRAELQIID